MALPKLKITGLTFAEGNDGTTAALVTVSLSRAIAKVVTVKYATLDSTALAGTDYTATSGVLAFAKGEITKTIAISIIGDTLKEINEKFMVELSAPTNATLSLVKSATVVIANDDKDVVFDGWDTSITNDADNVTTTTSNDRVLGLNGDDYIDGNAGQDSLVGGAGNDTLLGSAGNDTLNGSDGVDSLDGGDGADLLFGGFGNDTLDGSNGNDVVNGDAGNDTLYDYDSYSDTLNGGAGNDTLISSVGSDSLNGGEGNDYLYSAWGGDTLNGGAGNDIIYTYGGSSLLLGGDGDDQLGYYITSTKPLTTAIATGSYANDSLQGGAGNDLLAGGQGEDTFIFELGDSGVGSGHRDVITDFYATSTLEVIDISALSGNKLTFKGSAAFDGADQVRYTPDFVNKMTVIQINLNADLAPDMEIQLTGIIGLSNSDFVL